MMAAESKSQLDLPLQKMENYQQMSLSNQGFLFKAIQLANIHMIFCPHRLKPIAIKISQYILA